MEKRSIGIVLPAYRPDWDNLVSYVERLERELEPDRILVELDGEPPAGELPDGVEINFSPGRRGKGAAVSHGFRSLDTDVLAFVDADGSVPPSSLQDLLESVGDGIAIGSRRHPSAEIKNNQTLVRKSLGDAFSLFARWLLPLDIEDYQCGAKALHADAWEEISSDVDASGFSWDFQVVTEAYRKGYSIEEVPVVWNDREGSTVPVVQTSLELALQLLRSRSRM